MMKNVRRIIPSTLTYGLGRKIGFSFGAVLVIFVMITSYVNLGTQQGMITTRLDERSKEMTALLSEISSSYLFELRVSDLEIILQDIQQQPDIAYIKVIDPDGFVLATGMHGNNTFLTTDEHPSIEKVQKSRQWVIKQDNETRHITSPIEFADKYLGTLRLGLALDQYRSDIKILQYRNAVIGAVFLLIGLLVSLMMSRRLTHPLRRLIDITRSARDGNLDQSLEISTNDEIETLADEFGEMLRNLRDSMGQINRLAYLDSLTGLRNRAWLTGFLNQIAENVENEKSAIIFLDLDRFKIINDTYGHDIGDKVLCEMATRLKNVIDRHAISYAKSDLPEKNQSNSEHVRQRWDHQSRKDVAQNRYLERRCVSTKRGNALGEIGLARLGGDEFTVILRNLSNFEQVETLAQAIITAMRQPFDIGKTTFKTSASIGVAFLPDHGTTGQDILKSADVAMYQAKKDGRDTYRIFDPEIAAQTADRLQMEQNLIAGIAEDQLVLHFQPQFDVATQKTIAAEALVRWHHPVEGLIAPNEFLPLAEDVGLMENIGRFVVSEGIKQASKWPCNDGVEIRLAINIGVKELSSSNFVEFILEKLKETGFPPERLELEVTEGTAMEEDAKIEMNIGILRDIGIRFAVDDFGVGYSNLSRLKALKFDVLKIDRSLLSGVGEEPISEAVMTSLLQLSNALNLEVVAEGVERVEQLQFLQHSGCKLAQGFGLAKPLPNHEFLKMLKLNTPINFFDDNKKTAA